MEIRRSLGLFLTPVTRDLALTVADFTLAVVVQNIAWSLSQALVGTAGNRFGLRVTNGGRRGDLRRWTCHHGHATRRTRVDHLGRVYRRGVVVHGILISDDRPRPRGLRGAAWYRLCHRVTRDALVPLITQALWTREAWQIGALLFLLLAVAVTGCILGQWCRSGAQRDHDLNARANRPGNAEPAISRTVEGLFCLRSQPCLPDDAFARCDLRPGPDDECESACRDQRRELRRARC